MVTQNSNIMANNLATPPTLNDVAVNGGRVRCVVDSFEVNAAGSTGVDADGDYFLLCRLPSKARILQFWVSSDDLDSGSNVALNYGIYTTGGSVKDEDIFASAVTHQGAVAVTDVRFEAAAANISNWQSPLYTLAGDSADPGGFYDIAATNTAASSGLQAGTLAFMIMYTVD